MPKDFNQMAAATQRATTTSATGQAAAALSHRFDRSRIVPFHAEITKIAPNPRNPDDLAVQEIAASLTAVGQLQTAVVLTREAYLEAYPDEEDAIPHTATWVMFMGNRRLAGAILAGWTHLEVVLSHTADSAPHIEDRILHENIHNKDLPLLKEAELLRSKMQRDRLSARQLAKAIGKSHAYVNQRLALTNLIPEFQRLIHTGDMGLKEARRIAPHNPTRQHELLTLRPTLQKLIPPLRDLADHGTLNTHEIHTLANLPETDQRNHLTHHLTTQNPEPTHQPATHNPTPTTTMETRYPPTTQHTTPPPPATPPTHAPPDHPYPPHPTTSPTTSKTTSPTTKSRNSSNSSPSNHTHRWIPGIHQPTMRHQTRNESPTRPARAARAPGTPA